MTTPALDRVLLDAATGPERDYVIYFDLPMNRGRFSIYIWYPVGDQRRATELPIVIADSLADARKWLPPGLKNLGRHPKDARVIVEVWS